MTWKRFDPCDYEKEPLIARLCSGEEVLCWPNAGKLCAIDGSGRDFEGYAHVLVRTATPAEAPGFYGLPTIRSAETAASALPSEGRATPLGATRPDR